MTIPHPIPPSGTGAAYAGTTLDERTDLWHLLNVLADNRTHKAVKSAAWGAVFTMFEDVAQRAPAHPGTPEPQPTPTDAPERQPALFVMPSTEPPNGFDAEASR